MKNPNLIPKPFAQNGQKDAIPTNHKSDLPSQKATWDTGFPQITMMPVTAGGLPPSGRDFNGILNQISENIVYLSQGGKFKYSQEYADSTGGYPKGAILQSDDETREFQSLTDNNKINFNKESSEKVSAAWKQVSTTQLLDELNKKLNRSDVVQSVGNSKSQVMSQNAVTDALNTKQDKGDYATNTALNQVNDNANSRLAKAKNGADIPNKPEFINNIGAYPKTGGTIEGKVFTTSDMDVAGWIGGAKLYERYNDGEWAQVYSEAHKPKPEEIGVYSTKEVDDRFAYKISQDTFTCGNLHVNATHDWAGVVFKKPSGYSTTLAANPDNSESMLTIRYRDKKDNTLNYVDFLKKTGTVALTSQLLGVGQRWIDSTSIRHNDARYTNNTDKPIVVYVESEMTNKRTGPYSMGGEVDGLRVGYFWVSTVGIHSISFIVPPGSSYIVKAGWGVNLTPDAITRWIELR